MHKNNEAASRVAGEVVFMVFWSNKGLLFCDLFCTVVNVELSLTPLKKRMGT